MLINIPDKRYLPPNVKPATHCQDFDQLEPTQLRPTRGCPRTLSRLVLYNCRRSQPSWPMTVNNCQSKSMSWRATWYCGSLWLVAPADCSWFESLSHAHMGTIQANCSRRVQLPINILNWELYSRTGTPDGFTTGLRRLVGSSWPKSWQCAAGFRCLIINDFMEADTDWILTNQQIP